jgi:hypothetical protein
MSVEENKAIVCRPNDEFVNGNNTAVAEELIVAECPLYMGSIFKISEGKVAENRTVPDVLGMMRQIGVIPEPGQSEEASLT